MDCLIRVIKGPDTGASAPIAGGTVLIGRSPSAAVRLTSPEISWEHAQITRNDNDCTLENLSASGSYLGDARVSGAVKLRHRDQIRLSDGTILRFEATGVGAGRRGRGIMAAVIVAMLAAALVIAFNPFERKRGTNWAHAYSTIGKWVVAEQAAGRLPPTSQSLLAEAWRLEQARDYKKSREAWVQLDLLIDRIDRDMGGGLSKQLKQYPDALERLLDGPQAKPPADPNATGAAFVQFVGRRLAWSTANSKDSGGFGLAP